MCGQFAILGSLKAIKDYYEFLKGGNFVLDEDDFYGFDTIPHLKQHTSQPPPCKWGGKGGGKYYHAVLPCDSIKPMMYVPIVVVNKKLEINSDEIGKRINFLPARWGLVPFWAKDESFAYKTINARQETLSQKASFKYAYEQRRCLVPFTGYYEREERGGKLHYFSNEKNDFKSFAGLFEIWGDEKLITFTIVTCPAIGEVAKVHQRMPMILNEEEAIKWIA